MHDPGLPDISAKRILLFAVGLYGAEAVTEDYFREMSLLFGWPIDDLRDLADELGINIGPGELVAL